MLSSVSRMIHTTIVRPYKGSSVAVRNLPEQMDSKTEQYTRVENLEDK